MPGAGRHVVLGAEHGVATMEEEDLVQGVMIIERYKARPSSGVPPAQFLTLWAPPAGRRRERISPVRRALHVHVHVCPQRAAAAAPCCEWAWRARGQGSGVDTHPRRTASEWLAAARVDEYISGLCAQ